MLLIDRAFVPQTPTGHGGVPFLVVTRYQPGLHPLRVQHPERLPPPKVEPARRVDALA